MSLSTSGRFALVLSIPALVVACVVDSSPGSSVMGGSGGAVPSTSAGPPASTSSNNGAPSEHPILAIVDTNQTMTAAPGQGAGVFAEYDSGGQWNVFWMCGPLEDGGDAPCPFDVKISVGSGTIATPATQGFQTTDTLTVSSTQIEAVTSTSVTQGQEGVTFTTTPGATITLSASIAGQYDGEYVFFVEGGKVDDGFTGTVTDPIMLQGSKP
jgi:hypothetical protein